MPAVEVVVAEIVLKLHKRQLQEAAALVDHPKEAVLVVAELLVEMDQLIPVVVVEVQGQETIHQALRAVQV